MRPCIGVDGVPCGALTHGTRCASCHRRHKAKYSTASGHKATRAAWKPIVATGEVTCARYGFDPKCPGLIAPTDAWDLGHQDDGTELPEHAPCNRRNLT